MIEKTYRCNLCNDTHDPAEGQLFGLKWIASVLVVTASPGDVEHHICRACFSAIAQRAVLLGETKAAE